MLIWIWFRRFKMVYKVGFLEKIFGEKFPKVVTKYYKSGQKKEEGTVTGKNPSNWYTRNGLWTSWYENGQKRYERTYKDGKKDGISTWWYENGQKEREATYKDGERDGLWTRWYENGQKDYESTWKDGKKDGLYTAWYSNGQKSEEGTYKAGKRVGKSVTYWYKTGKKKYEGTYKNGKKDGLWTERYKNGRKKEEKTYKDGKFVSSSKRKPFKNRKTGSITFIDITRPGDIIGGQISLTPGQVFIRGDDGKKYTYYYCLGDDYIDSGLKPGERVSFIVPGENNPRAQHGKSLMSLQDNIFEGVGQGRVNENKQITFADSIRKITDS